MNTLFIGKVQHCFDELPSTNDFAVDLVAKRPDSFMIDLPEGTVVRAVTQSAGRGQFGSHWKSEPNQNLTISIILYPEWLAIRHQFHLSMAVALGLHDTVCHFCADETQRERVRIEWPNDLYIDNMKVAGILIQNSLQGSFFQSAVVGIGLNANQIDFDPSLPNPTSLRLFFGAQMDLDLLAAALYYFVEMRYRQLQPGKMEEIQAAYTARLFGIGQVNRFVARGSEDAFEAGVQGVGLDGKLQLKHHDDVFYYDLKEIALVFGK